MIDTFKRRWKPDVDDYRLLMMRELLVWLFGVPVTIALAIGLFVF